MTDDAGPSEDAPETPKKKGSKILLLALPVALLLGGGAFYGVYSGIVPLPMAGAGEKPAKDAAHGSDDAPEMLEADRGGATIAAFVPLDPMVVSLGPDSSSRHLKVSVQIEVAGESTADVAALKPRIADVLNTFLRAVEPEILERPREMTRLRAQMLRRVQLVTPAGTVRDVLIQEFVLN